MQRRQTALRPTWLDGYADLAQTRWRRWRAKNRLEASTPEGFDELLATVIALADPVIAGENGGQKWDPGHAGVVMTPQSQPT